MNNREIAESFSQHRFQDTFDRLAPDIVWRLVGNSDLHGRDEVIAACRSTLKENEGTVTTWLRFVSTGDGPVVAVDAIGRYESPDGVSAVSSCDIYEFTDGMITLITSYAVEVDTEPR